MKVVVFFVALLAASSAFDLGKCPDLSTQPNFDISSFTGTWYKQWALNTPWELGTCIKYENTYDNTTGTLNIDSTLKTILGGVEELRGKAIFLDSDSTDGKLSLTMNTYVGDVTGDLWVLSTDYENYAILYSCSMEQLGWFTAPYQSVWVLTREQQLDTDTSLLVEAAMAVVSHDGGPKFSELVPSSQKDCSA